MRRFSVVGLFSAIALAAACSLVNAPGDVVPGTGAGGHAGSGGSDHCVTDKDCPASDVPCTRYACALGGVCQLVTLGDGEPCDDGHYCTVDDVCEDGKCKGDPRPCPDQDACNVGACDEDNRACEIVFADPSTPCDDGDPCTEDGTCDQGACKKGPDACAKLATDCTDAVCMPGTGCVTSNKQDGTFCGQSFCSNGQCAGGHCEIQAVNEGNACDDGLFCTVDDTCQKGHCLGQPMICPTIGQCVKGTCDEAAKQCVDTDIPDLAPCDDGNTCTAGEFCTNHVCGGGLPPSTSFTETFASGGPGWTKGTEWQIGHAKASSGGQDGNDPAFDKTGEGMVAGVEIGGLAFVDPDDPSHPLYYLTSPAFDDDKAGSMYLTFYRWLNTDYQPYMRDTIEVSDDDGATWHVVWENPADIPINDAKWTFQAVDISAYKGSAARVRFGFAIGSIGVYDEASWNIDQVKVQNAPCDK